MYAIYDEVARERIRDACATASARRVARQAGSARRWHRVAEWSAHRSARADQVLADSARS